jgi:hypothetical protein
VKIGPRIIFTSCFLLLFLYLTISSLQWHWEVKLFPLTIGISCLILSVVQFVNELIRVKNFGFKYDFIFDSPLDGAITKHEIIRRALIYFSWIYIYFISIFLFGFFVATFFFLLLYTYIQAKLKWYHSLLYSTVVWTSTIIFFDKILNLPWPQGMVLKWMGISP